MSALLLTILAAAGQIDRVVVFPDRAQVTRRTNVSCGSRVPVRFEGIAPAAQADSFRATASSGAVEGLRAELVFTGREFSAVTAGLVAQQVQLAIERAALDDARALAKTRGQLGARYDELALQLISKEMVAEKPDVKAWQAALDAALITRQTSARLSAENEAKARQLQRREEELNLKLANARTAAEKRAYTVEVLVSCKSASQTEVQLTYLVGDASWAPSYEARADEKGQFVDLATWATLRQDTGEEWRDVELVLSTAVPGQNATPPKLNTLVVQGVERAPEKKVLVRRDEYAEHARSGANVASFGERLSVALPVKERVTVGSAPVRVFVGSAHLKASFEWRVLPKLAPVAFRVAEVTNQGNWPLLPGPIDAFRPSGLVGRYSLERVAQGAPFTLSFGVEDAVRVKRTVVEELKRDTGVFNSRKRFTYAYKFEVTNYSNSSLEVSVADHYPVAELDDLEVALSEKTTPGYALNATDGIATWRVALKPLEKKTIDFAFRVDVPTSYALNGL